MTAPENKRPPRGSLELQGAPDGDIGSGKQGQNTKRAIQVDLPQHVIEEMKQGNKDGKRIRLSLGPAPALRVGENARPLRVSPSFPSSFRYEVYKHLDNEDSTLQFASLISHEMTMAEAKDSTKGAESSLATLQASLAKIQKDKEENSALFIGSEETPNFTHKRGGSKGGKLGLAGKRGGGVFRDFARSHPSSPSLQPSQKLAPPSSHPRLPGTNSSASLVSTATKNNAQRFALFHFLAVRPASEDEIVKATNFSKETIQPLLEKFARKVEGNNLWELTERWYKDLDVWSFPYSLDVDRQAAIENAIRAYDRLRISKEDKLWQFLLPKKERNKGKVLSKLIIGRGAVENLSQQTPRPAKDNDSAPAASNHRRAISDVTTGRSAPLDKSPSLARSPSLAKSSSIAKSPGRTNSEMAKTRAGHSGKGATADLPTKPAPAAKPSGTAKANKSKTESRTDFGDPDEGSDDIDEVLSVVNSPRHNRNSKSENDTPKTKQAGSGSKRKAPDNKYKSAEYIDDSSDLAGEIMDDEKPVANQTAIKVGNKKIKTNNATDGYTKSSKPAANPKDTTVTKNPSSTLGESVSKANPTSKGGTAPAKRSHGLSTNGTEQTNASSTTTIKPASNPSSSAPKSTIKSSNTVRNEEKSSPHHQNSGGISSGDSNTAKKGVKRALDDKDSSPHTPVKKPKPNGVAGKNKTMSSSSSLTNTSDLPSPSPPSGAGTPGQGIQDTQIEEEGHVATGHETPETTSETFAEQSTSPMPLPEDIIINNLMQQYSVLWEKHVRFILWLHKLIGPEGVEWTGEVDMEKMKAKNDNLRQMEDMVKAIHTVQKVHGREAEFPTIPDDFSTDAIEGLREWIDARIPVILERYGRNPGDEKDDITEAEKKDLNEYRMELVALEDLREH